MNDSAVRVRYGLGLALCGILPCLSGASVYCQDPPPKRPEEDRNYAQEIKALASRNPAPEIVDSGSSAGAIFAENFDWKDQERVQEVLGRFLYEFSEGSWRECGKHMGDDEEKKKERYSLTTIADGMSARNHTVESICQSLYYETLHHSYKQHLPRNESTYRRLNLDTYLYRQTSQEDPPDTRLYVLQIQECKAALRALSNIKIDEKKDLAGPRSKWSTKQKAECQAAIEETVAKLKKTKQPEIPEVAFGEYFSVYTPERAKKLRDEDKQEHFERVDGSGSGIVPP